jgi:Tol biopolymer transport system component
VAGHSELYLMRPDGTHQRPMTSVPPGTSGASWSPDGKRIAYGRPRNAGEQCDLYVANGEGTHARRLRHDGWCSDDPAWSPDGRRFAFDRRHPGVNGKTSIWTMNVGGTDLRQVTRGDLDLNPAWSPDGTTIAFVHGLDGIWLVDADGSNERQLTTREEDDQPDWSPDGEWIAFSREDGEYQSSVSGSTRYWVDICVVRPDGGDLRRLTRHAGVNVAPTWSPDGKRIVFASDRAHEDLMDMYVMSADGTRQKRLTRGGVLFRSGSPDWGARR